MIVVKASKSLYNLSIEYIKGCVCYLCLPVNASISLASLCYDFSVCILCLTTFGWMADETENVTHTPWLPNLVGRKTLVTTWGLDF